MVIFDRIKKYIKKIWCIMHHHFCSYEENIVFFFEIENYTFKFYQCSRCGARYFGCKDSAYDELVSRQEFKLHFVPIFREWVKNNPKRLSSWYVGKLERACEINRLQYHVYFGDAK